MMIRIMVLLHFVLVVGTFGATVFQTDFSAELGDKTYVEPKKGTYAAAMAKPGIFFSNKGVAFVADDHSGSWAPPEDTRGKGALRMGYAYAADFQLRMVLAAKWDPAKTYKLRVRHRAWPKSGKPDGNEMVLLNVMIGAYDDEPDWLASKTYIPVDSEGWTITELEIPGSEIGTSAGKQIVLRLQKKEPSRGGEYAVWIDSIKLSAVPARKSGEKH